MSDIRVRKATLSDCPALLGVKREGSTVLLARLGHGLGQIKAWQDRFVTEEYVRQHVRSPHSLYLIEEDGVAKGMAGLTLKDDGDDSFCLFGNLYTLRSGKSFGSRLMEFRLGVVENFNVDYIQSHVHSENERAQRFVEHYGFRRHGSYYEERLETENIIYRKKM